MIFSTNKEKGNAGLGIAVAYYQVALKSCGGTKGNTYKTFIETDVNLLFIVTDKMEMYLIPKEIIKNKSTINLCNKYERFKVSL